jgi:hypothetical protein
VAGFSVTSPTNRIVLDRAREGQLVFAVTNQTGHDVRARATPVAEGRTDPSWLRVVGQVERDFVTNATEPVSAAIAVSREAPVGEYHFRLDVASVTVPDEEWARGPVIAFQVGELPPPPPPPEEPAGYLETVGGALMGALVVGVVLFGVGVVFGMAAASGVTGGNTGGGIGDILGNIIAQGFAMFIVLAFMLLAFGALGAWLGPVIGAFIVLRFRDFPDPWLTALPMIILIPVIGVPLLLVLGGIAEALRFGGAVQTIWLLLTLIIAVIVPALAARAFARWRGTGHL